MRLIRCLTAAIPVLLLTGCTSGLSEVQVQARIDKAINSLRSELRAEFSGQAPAAAPAAEIPSAEPASQHNAEVDSELNAADISLREGDEKQGCLRIQWAIAAARAGVSDDQSSQLSSYAQRCRLRY